MVLEIHCLIVHIPHETSFSGHSLTHSHPPGEGLHGCWKSEKGQVTIGKDPVTARLSYTVPLAAVKFWWLAGRSFIGLLWHWKGTFEILTLDVEL